VGIDTRGVLSPPDAARDPTGKLLVDGVQLVCVGQLSILKVTRVADQDGLVLLLLNASAVENPKMRV
jgi:hypothetical protein